MILYRSCLNNKDNSESIYQTYSDAVDKGREDTGVLYELVKEINLVSGRVLPYCFFTVSVEWIASVMTR